MSTRTVLLLGLFFRLAGIKQGLWYSHSKNSLSLRLSCRIVDTVFSSTPSSIPVHSRKIRYVGHGIRCKPFVDARKKAQKPRHGILVLGRIAKIKNIERAIQSISESEIENPELTCVGPVESNSTYHLDLLRFASQKHVKIVLEGPYEYSAIPLLLVKYDAIFTGTPKSVDKAAIEGALSGCFVITDQEETIELTGMREIWKLLGFPCSPNLIMQINLLSKMNAHDKLALRSVLSDKCAQLNNVDETVKKILKEIARVNDRH
jgi:glycosyltransferase involved in cell wall biosynthesis